MVIVRFISGLNTVHMYATNKITQTIRINATNNAANKIMPLTIRIIISELL